MKTISRRLRRHLPALLLIAAVAIIISVRHLNEPPAYIHAWAQADNYSLALGFRHNGGDLFHPQTLIYNKQQLGFEDPESLVTACDLPLHHWLVSILMAITGSTQPWVFRGFTLAVAILGLWALYLLVFVLARSRVKALLVAIFTATAPSYAYYSGYGWPLQESVVEDLFTTNASGGDISGLLSDSLSEEDKMRIQAALPSGATGVTVEGVDRSMTESKALVTATLSAGGEQSYQVSLVRDGIGWKVSNVTVEYPALDGGVATIDNGTALPAETPAAEATEQPVEAPAETEATAEGEGAVAEGEEGTV